MRNTNTQQPWTSPPQSTFLSRQTPAAHCPRDYLPCPVTLCQNARCWQLSCPPHFLEGTPAPLPKPSGRTRRKEKGKDPRVTRNSFSSLNPTLRESLRTRKKRKRKCFLKRNSLRITMWSIRARRMQSPHHEQVLRTVRRRKRLRKPINPPWLEMRQQRLAASSLIQTISIYLNRRVWNLFKPKCSPPSVHTQFPEKAHAFNRHYMQNASTGQNGWCS